MLELVLGGAASGKSECAERLALDTDPHPIYLATMERGDPAGELRIDRHVKRREGSGFITVEQPRNAHLAAPFVKGHTVLLECMTNLAANELFGAGGRDTGTGSAFIRLKLALDKLEEASDRLIVVSGDIFRDGMIYDPMTEEYMRLLADMNRYMAERARHVYEAVFGCCRKVR